MENIFDSGKLLKLDSSEIRNIMRTIEIVISITKSYEYKQYLITVCMELNEALLLRDNTI